MHRLSHTAPQTTHLTHRPSLLLATVITAQISTGKLRRAQRRPTQPQWPLCFPTVHSPELTRADLQVRVVVDWDVLALPVAVPPLRHRPRRLAIDAAEDNVAEADGLD